MIAADLQRAFPGPKGGASAGIIGMDRFHACQRFQSGAQRPTMAALLAELDGINPMETDFGNPPPRVIRPQPEFD